MGAHYTGACMGMAYASRAIRLWPALLVMAPLALLGAAFASHNVELTVGRGIVEIDRVTTGFALVIVAVAFALTTLYTYLRVPTSTIQILVFAVAGAAVADGLPLHWATIVRLAILWVLAPFAACALGFVFTRTLDRRLPSSARGTASILPGALVAVGAAASFAMGANDVSNATGVLVMTHLSGVLVAGVVGGAGLALGVLTWGKPLLQRVAFDIVRLDLTMATAAQLVQALVILIAVAFGYFTSMNQALVGAMAGTGLARGRRTIEWPTVNAILRGWALAPLSGFVLSYLVVRLAEFVSP